MGGGGFIVIPLNSRVKGSYSPTSAVESKGIIMVLMGNYYELYKYLCHHYISFVIMHVYSIAFMINR